MNHQSERRNGEVMHALREETGWARASRSRCTFITRLYTLPTSSDRSSSWKRKECSGDMRPRNAFQRARRLEKASIGERGYSLWGGKKKCSAQEGKGLHETAEPLRVRKLPAFEPCERGISAPLLSVALLAFARSSGSKSVACCAFRVDEASVALDRELCKHPFPQLYRGRLLLDHWLRSVLQIALACIMSLFFLQLRRNSRDRCVGGAKVALRGKRKTSSVSEILKLLEADVTNLTPRVGIKLLFPLHRHGRSIHDSSSEKNSIVGRG